MLLPVIKSVEDVAARQLCSGCGACAYAQPERYEMVDTLDQGRRPVCREDAPADDGSALAVCPGRGLEHDHDCDDPALIHDLLPGWGPVLDVWEGYATDDNLRFSASSGGASTALALACMEAEGMHGVLHIRSRRDAPYLNETVLSTTPAELLEATGSRYAPASPCEGLHLIEQAPAPCVFIGKPCDVAAAQLARRQRPALDERLGATIAFFCAGTPTTRATLRMLERMGVDDLTGVTSLRYRGRGWPGRATVTFRRGALLGASSLSYEQAWGEILTHDKQWRCHLCADHTGEFADLAVGDPWQYPADPDEPGRSLILVRTRRGARILRLALESGHLEAAPVAPDTLPAAQPNLLRGRGAIWGRRVALRVLGLPAPKYTGFATFRFWCSELSWLERLRSLVGVARRAVVRGLWRRVPIRPFEAPASSTTPELPTPPPRARRSPHRRSTRSALS